MEKIKNEKIYAFDSLYTTNHIQILKILLPCLNPPLQKNLALFIKFLEFRYTIFFLNAHPHVLEGCGFDKSPMDWQIFENDMLPYLTPKEAEKIKQLKKSMNMMKQFSSMQKNMEALKDILPEGMDLETILQGMKTNPMADETADMPGGEILKNMMTSSQMDTFEKFNERFKNI